MRFALSAGLFSIFLAGCSHSSDCCSDCCSDEAATGKVSNTAVAPAQPKWQMLFDGQTLNNWKVTEFGGQGTPKVKDGAIILPMGSNLTGLTWAGPELPTMSYEVRCEAQRVTGSDFFLGLTFPVAKSHASLILGGWGGSTCGISSLDGGDAANNSTTKVRNFEEKRWYRVRLRVTPHRIEAWLDDEELVNVITDGKSIDTRPEVDASKPFGLATYSTTGAVRDLKVRKLDDDELPAPPEKE